MIDGKYLDMPTTELAGGSRFLYIFQSIFVKHLEVNPVVRFLTDTVFISHISGNSIRLCGTRHFSGNRPM